MLLWVAVASDGYLAMICTVGLDLAGFGFWISIWCYNCRFRGLVWCLYGVLEVMVVVVVVVLLFGVFGWLVQWYCYVSVSMDVEDRYRDKVMGEK